MPSEQLWAASVGRGGLGCLLKLLVVVHRSRNNCPSFVIWFGFSRVWKINTDEGAFVF